MNADFIVIFSGRRIGAMFQQCQNVASLSRNRIQLSITFGAKFGFQSGPFQGFDKRGFHGTWNWFWR